MAMPAETKAAVDWALTQTAKDLNGSVLAVSKDSPQLLVDKVREYFDNHPVTYATFSCDDLTPYLPK